MATSARRPAGAWLLHPVVKPAVFLACLVPFAWLFWGALADTLGANPAEALIRATGDWTLRFLCLTLAITPARVVFGLPPLARLRRMVGVFTWFYALLHLLAYALFDMGFEAGEIARDIAKRPFILVGFTAFVLLTLMAATSFNRAIRTLGARRWQQLHRVVYAVAGLALLHFFWMRSGKNDYAEVLVYASVVGVLLGWRAWRHLSARRAERGVLSARTGKPGEGALGR
ncbi:protein-methionine-sulfoxide reductase heme-binding subunit MsrQ [Ramlibacter sp. AN1015]|uniref:sulfite oxidase heme-binding subunit YedZ n=1 Tax=Ramlibacter sp. AN1015 TaxID=3133428 RepID=UPI0030C5FBCB